jgi:hypothetical protein
MWHKINKRLIYKHQHEGVWFSHAGHTAYERGERPRFMWPEGTKLVATIAHHIARQLPGSYYGGYTRESVMFFRDRPVSLVPPTKHPKTLHSDSIEDYWENAIGGLEYLDRPGNKS